MKNRTLAESAGFTSRRPVLGPQVDHGTSSDHPWSLDLSLWRYCPTITIGGLSRLGPTGQMDIHARAGGATRASPRENRFGSAFFAIPGLGPVLVAGPLVAWIVGVLEGAAVVGGLGAIGAGLYGMGIPINVTLHLPEAVGAAAR